jgi:flagellar biosynthesis protein FlhG
MWPSEAAQLPEDQAAGLRLNHYAGSGPRPPPKVIAVASGKGGVGKTTVSVNLATAIAQTGRKTLLLDGDMGLANVDVLLGLTPAWNLSHVLEGRCALEDTILEGPAGLMVVPAASGKKNMAELSPAENAGIVRAFSELRREIDVLIVDTAAGIADSVTTLSAASQEVVVVVTNDPASITDAYALIKVLSRDHGVNRIQVLANQVANLGEAREIYAGLERVSERFLDVTLAFVGAVPYDDWLKTAVRRQKPVVELYPGSPSALAFQAIARRVEAWVPPTAARGHLEFFVERLLQQPQGVAA